MDKSFSIKLLEYEDLTNLATDMEVVLLKLRPTDFNRHIDYMEEILIQLKDLLIQISDKLHEMNSTDYNKSVYMTELHELFEKYEVKAKHLYNYINKIEKHLESLEGENNE